MITFSGKSVFPNTSEAPTLEDIGIGLGAAFRFRRQTEDAYPVLAHVLTVAAIVPVEHAIDGLLHDAAEAILGDMPSTWKTKADEEREAEIMSRIYRDLGLTWPISSESLYYVQTADLAAKEAEAHVLGLPDAEKCWPTPNYKVMQITERHLEFAESMLNAQTAALVFTEAYEHYTELAKNEEAALS